MLTVSQINAQRDRSNTALKKMEQVMERINAEITKLEANKSLDQKYRSKRIQEERDKLQIPAAEELQIIKDAARISQGQKQFWENRTYLLSLQKASEEPSEDALIKSQWTAEFERMPPPLLQTAFEDARFDMDLARLWVVFRTGQFQSHQNAEFRENVSMSLEGIELPGQAEALASISTCWSNHAHGDRIFSLVLGKKDDPMRKMNIGRAQQVTNRFVASADQVAAAKKAAADAEAKAASDA